MLDSQAKLILLSTLVSNSAYALIAPFLPIEYQRKGVSAISIGAIFAVYSLSVILCSPLVGRAIIRFGRSKIISVGLFSMGFCFVLLGLVDQISSQELIVICSIFLRVLQGASSAFVQTTCYAVAINDYPDHREAMIGYIEAVTGVGLIIGPIIGSTLYTFLGFDKTFFLYGSAVIVFAIFVTCKAERYFHRPIVHSEIQISNEDDDFKTESSLPPKKIQIIDLFRSTRFFFAGLSGSLCYFCYSYLEPILA
jgi:MFS family permease